MVAGPGGSLKRLPNFGGLAAGPPLSRQDSKLEPADYEGLVSGRRFTLL